MRICSNIVKLYNLLYNLLVYFQKLRWAYLVLTVTDYIFYNNIHFSFHEGKNLVHGKSSANLLAVNQSCDAHHMNEAVTFSLTHFVCTVVVQCLDCLKINVTPAAILAHGAKRGCKTDAFLPGERKDHYTQWCLVFQSSPSKSLTYWQYENSLYILYKSRTVCL